MKGRRTAEDRQQKKEERNNASGQKEKLAKAKALRNG